MKLIGNTMLLPSVKNTWAALYIGRFGFSKSFIKARTESTLGVIKYIESIVGSGSRFL